MKRILLSLAIISIVAAGAIGATRAYFSDTVVASGNTFIAGTMNLKMDSNPDGNGYTWVDSFSNTANPFANVKPGATGEQIVDIMNVGGISGRATIKLERTDSSDLQNNLDFAVYFKGSNNDTAWTPVASGPLSVWNGNTYDLGLITTNEQNVGGTAGSVASVKIVWSVPTTAGNDIQGDTLHIDTTFGLEQVH
jgi:predicted ribosomally synthesized peptide with SipW-like signal peptide